MSTHRTATTIKWVDTQREKGREFLIRASRTSLFVQEGWTPFLLLICKVYVHYFRHVVIEVGPSYRPSLHFVLDLFASWVCFISLKVTWQPKQRRRFREQLLQNLVEVEPNGFTGHQFIGRVKGWYTHGTVRSLVVYQDKHSNLLCLHMRGEMIVQCKFKDQPLKEVFYLETLQSLSSCLCLF